MAGGRGVLPRVAGGLDAASFQTSCAPMISAPGAPTRLRYLGSSRSPESQAPGPAAPPAWPVEFIRDRRERRRERQRQRGAGRRGAGGLRGTAIGSWRARPLTHLCPRPWPVLRLRHQRRGLRLRPLPRGEVLQGRLPDLPAPQGLRGLLPGHGADAGGHGARRRVWALPARVSSGPPRPTSSAAPGPTAGSQACGSAGRTCPGSGSLPPPSPGWAAHPGSTCVSLSGHRHHSISEYSNQGDLLNTFNETTHVECSGGKKTKIPYQCIVFGIFSILEKLSVKSY